MRIGIDVRYLSHGLVGGVHAYVANFVPALIKLALQHHVYLYADTKSPLEITDLPDHVQIRYLPYRSPLSSIYYDLLMRNEMAKDRLDVVHFPANYGFGPSGAATVITLHDVINILPLREILRGHRKQPRTMAMMTYLHFVTLTAIPRAAMLLTVSEYSREQISSHTGFDRRRIRTAYLSPSPNIARIEDPVILESVRVRFELPRQFILADALKNPAILIQAWRALPPALRQGRQIVFFCRRSDPLAIVFDAVANGEAKLLVRPSNEDLGALYSMAQAFVFPSPFEGFGLPVIEAMKCGAPVISSDRGPLPEVTGGAALLVDSGDVVKMADHLQSVLELSELRNMLRARGFARSSLFSWEKSASRILETYEMAMNVCGSGIT